MDHAILDNEVTSSFREGMAVRHAVSDLVLDTLLEAVQSGTLQPGSRVHDGQLAQELGVSRTPVREALQRMKDMGLIETVPNRFTRIVTVDELALRDSLRVWEGLYAVLVRDTLSRPIAEEIIDELRALSERFVSEMTRRDARGAAHANHDFYSVLARASKNEYLSRGLESVVHVIQLGALSLPKWVDTDALHRAHVALTEALAAGDEHAALAAVHDAATVGFVVVTPPES